jgi:uncharacterized protein (DUF342 family)/FixJ family two-component response regulator
MPDIQEHGILVADDEESVLISLRRLLKSNGFSKISSALNAEQALRFIEDAPKPFFLIIADQEMPGMKGSELLEKCVALTPESRRMLMTGYPNISIIEEGVNKGNIQKYIVKPWNNDDLLKRIKEELQVYERYQDKKDLHKTLQFQNTHFFRLAKKIEKKDEKFQKDLSLKKIEIDSLNKCLKEIKENAEKSEGRVISLDGLLSRNIIINQANLARAFATAKKETGSFFHKISKKNNIFFFDEDIELVTQNQKLGGEDVVSMFEVIDLIINQVKKNVESSLYSKGDASILKSDPDTHKTPPDIGELAYKEGYITRDELEQTKELLEVEGLGEEQKKIEIKKALLTSGLLTRIDLSRIILKKELIETRLKDCAFARELFEKGSASEKVIEQAFIKQWNIFGEKGDCVILGDILVDENLITPELRDEILIAHDRIEKYGEEVDSDLKALSEKAGTAINLRVSDDKIMAYVTIPESIRQTCDACSVRELLKNRGIKFGVIEDTLIQEFLKDTTDCEKELIIARGNPPVPGKDAWIKYHFDVQQKQIGIVAEDGTIDFRDRGNISFVKEWELLAEKIPLTKGESGRSVFGKSIPVDDGQDCSLQGGEGTRGSKDDQKLFSKIDGTPKIDLKGEIIVLKELNIKGDVNFEVGNINFPGNVIITGIVKDGFSVTCVDLTVNTIKGGIIKTSGDVNVSTGIIDSQVRAQGNVLTKFVNNSKIEALGNISVTQEIMESRIAVCGECLNEYGRITASTIAAKKGFTLFQVGTERSIASKLKAGVDDYTPRLVEVFDDDLAKVQKDIDLVKTREKAFEDKNFKLHKKIIEKSLAQENMQKKRASLKKQIIVLKDEKTQMAKVLEEIKEIELSIENTDKEIKYIFEIQDEITKAIAVCEQETKDAGTQLKELLHQKKSVLKAAEKDKGIPVVKVKKGIYEGTKIMGPETSMIIKHRLGPCKIMEIESSDPGGRQMVIQNF